MSNAQISNADTSSSEPAWLPAFMLHAYPAAAYPQEPVWIELTPLEALHECQARFAAVNSTWGDWQTEHSHHQSFVQPGASVSVLGQLRQGDLESAIAVGQVEVLPWCAIQPRLGPVAKVYVLDEGHAFMFACEEGVWRYDLRTNRGHAIRTGSLGTRAPLISTRNGKILTTHRVVVPTESRCVFVSEVHVHDRNGVLCGRFPLELGEAAVAMTADSHLVTRRTIRPDSTARMWRGEEIPVAETPQATRIWDIDAMRPIADYPGTLMATSPSGIGAVAYFFNARLDFLGDYHQSQIRSSYYLKTVRGGTGHKIWFSPSGAIAVVTVLTPVRQGAFTFEMASYEIVRTADGRWLADLGDKLKILRFVTESLLWVLDLTETAAANQLKLYEWTTGKTKMNIPLSDFVDDRISPDFLLPDVHDVDASQAVSSPLSGSIRDQMVRDLVDNLELLILHDPIMPDMLFAAYPNSGCNYLAFLARAEQYRVLHWMSIPVDSRPLRGVAAGSKHMYTVGTFNRGTPRRYALARYDLATGRYRDELDLSDLAHSLGNSFDSHRVATGGPLVVVASTREPLAFALLDERSGKCSTWQAPPGVIAAEFLDTDDAASTVLWKIDMGDAQLEQAYLQEASQRLDALFGELMKDESAGTASHTKPAADAPMQRPPRLYGICTWHCLSGEMHMFALPAPAESASFASTGDAWLILTLRKQQQFNTDHTRLTKEIMLADVYSVSVAGKREKLLSLPVESHIDERVSITTSTDQGRYTSGKIYTPCFALSRYQPGHLAFCTLHEFGMLDVFAQGKTVWRCPNPIAARYDMPQRIVAYPDNHIWAFYSDQRAIVIGADGQVDDTEIGSAYYPPMTCRNAIIFTGAGMWRPLHL